MLGAPNICYIVALKHGGWGLIPWVGLNITAIDGHHCRGGILMARTK